MFLNFKFRKIITILSVLFAFLFGLIRLADPEFVEVTRLKYFDILQKNNPRVTPGQTYTVIVDIDEKSLKEIGQWPWPRTILAELFEKAGESGMLVLGLDVLFAEQDRTSPSMIAKNLKKSFPELSKQLQKLPSNEQVAVKSMSKIPIVLGHSAINIKGDANKNYLKGSSVKANIGVDPKKKWLKEYPGILANVEEFEKSAVGAGTISLAKEPDGIIRRIPIVSNIAGIIRPTLALEMVRIAFQGNSIATKTGVNGIEEVLIQTKTIGKAAIPTDSEGRVWIHFGKSDSKNLENSRYYVSAADIINGRVGKERLQGKLGILGTSATGLKDIKPTPVDERMPGVEIHANLIDTVISAILYYSSNKNYNDVYNSEIKQGKSKEEALIRAEKVKISGSPFLSSGVNMPFYEAIFIIVLGMIFTITALKFGPILNISFLGLILGGAFYLSYVFYIQKNILFDPTFAGFSTFFIYFGTTFSNYLRDAREKKQIRGAFSQYLSPALVEQLAADPDKLVLGGETKQMTFLFCDVRGFTTISESFKYNPQGLTKLINRFLTPLTNEIINKEGTIDKYMGDCIMAFWNAPINVELHEKLACESALNMHKALAELNNLRQIEAQESKIDFLELKIGIGVNTGGCVVGNMGSDQRFDYSVLGDAVNLASRLEGQSKGYGVKTVIGSETYQKIKEHFAILQLDKIAVKGKKESVAIFALVGDKSMFKSEEFQKLKSKHELILKNYFNQDWDKAIDEMNHSKNLCNNLMDEYYEMMISRIKEFKTLPPSRNWDGVYVAQTK